MDDAHATLLARLRGSRAVLPHTLSTHMCRQLLCIHNALAVRGYRPHVRSLTLYELLAAQPQLLGVLAEARQVITDAVEAFFDVACMTWAETTSLISWGPGGSIGWHHDANRPYLSARHFSAVAYLSTQGQDFEGGSFLFQSGAPPLRVEPAAGLLLLYTADDSNVHCVEPVTAGQRCTLTMWFTLDAEHQEDSKVLSKLASSSGSGLPAPMYVQEDGSDIRLVQLQQLLGVTVRPCTCPSAATAALDAQQQPSDGDCVVVECCSHTAPAAGSSCSSHGHFNSIQEAVLALHVLLWRQGGRRCERCCCTMPEAALHGADGAGQRGSAGCIVQQLPRAQQLLQEYLQQGAEQMQQLVPLWHELRALVVPSADAHV